MIIWVIYRHASEDADEHKTISEEQAIYMREVRQRNRADIQDLVNLYRVRRGSRNW